MTMHHLFDQWFSNLPEGTREWTFSGEGLPAGWAFLAFLVLAAASVLAYRKCAPSLSRRFRVVAIGLRLVSILVLLILLVRPVVQLTINQPVRQSLLILLDSSSSMTLEDVWTSEQDLRRLKSVVSRDVFAGERLKRWDLLEAVWSNPQLDLLPRLQEKADVVMYGFGRHAAQVGPLSDGVSVTLGDAVGMMKRIQPTEPASALGSSLKDVLEENRGRALAGIFMITDGASNSGSPPMEAARAAREAGVPLFLYGVGVPFPVDVVAEDLEIPRVAFVRERVDVKLRYRSQGVQGETATVILTADDREVARAEMAIGSDGDGEVVIPFVPEHSGKIRLAAMVQPLRREVSGENNRVEADLRVLDSKIRVLLIEQEPRWDFRYLLAYLQRDRRLDVKCALIDGAGQTPEPVYLSKLPAGREEIFSHDVIILGDVSPADLGEERMKLLVEWAEQAQGGLIFLAGPNFNPATYLHTPLADLLPVVPEPVVRTERRSKTAFPLKLTRAGEESPYLRLADDPGENLRIWERFPGVRWVAPIVRAKPGAEVLLVDPGRERNQGGMPVIAVQGFGSGATVFLGTDETYRWRSRKGEEYYAKVWSSIMQSLALQRLEGASARTQLKAERERYFVGEQVVLAGKCFKRGFEVQTAAKLDGELVIRGAENKVDRQPLAVSAVADQPGVYRAEFLAKIPGSYSFSTKDEPEAEVKFEVEEPNFEMLETSMQEGLLRAMAQTSGGHFVREENLDGLPDLVEKKLTTVPIHRKIELFRSVWWMGVLFLAVFLEWILRRLVHLK
jgi:hypothetical protein